MLLGSSSTMAAFSPKNREHCLHTPMAQPQPQGWELWQQGWSQAWGAEPWLKTVSPQGHGGRALAKCCRMATCVLHPAPEQQPALKRHWLGTGKLSQGCMCHTPGKHQAKSLHPHGCSWRKQRKLYINAYPRLSQSPHVCLCLPTDGLLTTQQHLGMHCRLSWENKLKNPNLSLVLI